MAMPHYTYLVLKMMTEQGVLSLCGNLNVAYSYEKECFALNEATNISIHIQDWLATAQQISLGRPIDPNYGGGPSINQVQGGEGSGHHPW